MSVAFLLWTLAVSTLILGGAAAAAAALRHLGRPERWVWTIALGTTAALPFLPAAASTQRAAERTGAAVFVPLSQVMAAASASLPEPTHVSIPWIPILWSLASAITVLALLGGAWSLARRRESWPRQRVEGDLLRISEDFGPAVVGWVDPEVVLPAWALSLEARQRRMILRHENEHRWARDPQLLALGVLLLAAAPWNPIAWLQFRGLRRAIEFDCDARVLSGGTSPRAYGRLLLSVQLDGGRGALFAPALREPASFLERRLQTMTLRDRPVARLRVLSLALVAALLTVVACEAPRPTQADVPASEVNAPASVIEEIRVAPAIEGAETLIQNLASRMVTFTVRTDGSLEVSRGGTTQRITATQVGAAWRAAEEDGVEIAHVRMHEDATVQRVTDVLETLEAAGATKVSFQTWGDPEEPPQGPILEVGIDTIVVEGEYQEVEGEAGRLSIRGRSSIQPQSDPLMWEGLGDDDSTTPLIYLDGVRITPTAREAVLGRVTPQDIERIEVIKGEDAARLYGADAESGIIQIFTKAN